MVLFQEQLLSVLLAAELMVTMLLQCLRLLVKLEDILLRMENLISLSLWHIEWVITQLLIILRFIGRRIKERSGNKKMIRLEDWRSFCKVLIIRIYLMKKLKGPVPGNLSLMHYIVVKSINIPQSSLSSMMFTINCPNILSINEPNWKNIF